jgi:hypothetical protein
LHDEDSSGEPQMIKFGKKAMDLEYMALVKN